MGKINVDPTYICDLCGAKKQQYSQAMPDKWSRIEVRVHGFKGYEEYEICDSCSVYNLGQDHYNIARPNLIKLIFNKLNPKEK